MTLTTEAIQISKIRQENDDLYKRVVKEAAALSRRGQVHCAAELAMVKSNGSSQLSPECAKLKVLLDEVNDFLNNLTDLSSDPETVEDYLWVCDTAVRWENVFSSLLNLPKSVPLSQPPADLLPPLPSGDALSIEELDSWVAKCSQIVWAYRLRNLPYFKVSSTDEMAWDWHQAEIFLASDILDGTLNFARRISSISYWRLEYVWLFDVRQLLAYLDWEKAGSPPFDPMDAEKHYLEACAKIREKLVSANLKATPAEFGEAKRYLEERYLTASSNGLSFKIDNAKLRQAGKYDIVAIKAERIKNTTNRTDEKQNWYDAETYVKMFYENIIPAVMTGNSVNVEAVLNAFHFSFSRENSYHIINCFEMALAIYFLKPEAVAELWKC